MKTAIISIFLLLSVTSYSQVEKAKRLKYEFERYSKDGTKKLKSGKYIEIELKSNDTLHVYADKFEKLEGDSIFLTLDYHFHSYLPDSEDAYSSKTMKYMQGFALNKSEVDRVSFSTTFFNIGSGLLGASFATIIFAPIAGIDSQAPDGFNVKRYKSYVAFSAITLVAGLPFSGKGKTYLKIP